MARETKVGLLVGLAFIVCFAIILANHGQRGALLEPIPTMTGRPAGKPSGGFAGVTNPSTPASLPPSIPPRVDRDSTLTPSALPLYVEGAGRGPFVEPQVAAGDAAAERIRELEAQLSELLAQKSAAQPPGGGTTLTSTGGPTTPAALPTSPPGTASESVNSGFTSSPPPRDEGVMSAGRRHVVAPGDTLSGIAQRYYGSKSGRLVAQLVEANKQVIKDPDRIPLGAELVIPADAGAMAKGPAAPSPSAGGASTASPRESARGVERPGGPAPKKEPSRDRAEPEKNPRPFRWYQVRKNDRYVSIARQELGDESRWKEIYELNKETFPREGMIREGVRIKLPPSEGVADSRGKRR